MHLSFVLTFDRSQEIFYHPSHMTAYGFTPSIQISPEVAARKAARKKVIQRAQELERKSYRAFMEKRRALQDSYEPTKQ